MELTQACLARIERHDRAINAFITITREQALAAAREMEEEIRRGRRRGPLHGIPIALKDNIDTAGVLTTAASGVFKDRVPADDADVVVRLKNAGAVLAGQTESSRVCARWNVRCHLFGPVRNPWALDRVAGGSSGGSAAAIAADMCLGTLGTDTGGSIRIPASLCGIVGFKPTYGRVEQSRRDPHGLDARPRWPDVQDGRGCGADTGRDRRLRPAGAGVGGRAGPGLHARDRMATSKLRVGVVRKPFFEGLNPDVAKAVEGAIEVLQKSPPA